MVETHRQIKTIKNESFATVVNYSNKELRESASKRPRLINIFPVDLKDTASLSISRVWVALIEYDQTKEEYEEVRKRIDNYYKKNEQVQAPKSEPVKKESEKKPAKKEEPKVEEDKDEKIEEIEIDEDLM